MSYLGMPPKYQDNDQALHVSISTAVLPCPNNQRAQEHFAPDCLSHVSSIHHLNLNLLLVLPSTQS